MSLSHSRSLLTLAVAPTGVGLALAHIVGRLLEWDLTDVLTPFLWYPIESAIYCVGWVVLLLATGLAVAKRLSVGRAAVAVVPLAVAFGADLVIPYTDVWLDLNYRTKMAERYMIVQAIRRMELAPNVPYNSRLIRLSPRPAVSKGGNEVVVQNYGADPFVLFYTYRGVLSHYAGFLWVPESGNARGFDDLDQGAVIEHKEGQWYYVSR